MKVIPHERSEWSITFRVVDFLYTTLKTRVFVIFYNVFAIHLTLYTLERCIIIIWPMTLQLIVEYNLILCNLRIYNNSCSPLLTDSRNLKNLWWKRMKKPNLLKSQLQLSKRNWKISKKYLQKKSPGFRQIWFMETPKTIQLRVCFFLVLQFQLQFHLLSNFVPTTELRLWLVEKLKKVWCNILNITCTFLHTLEIIFIVLQKSTRVLFW